MNPVVETKAFTIVVCQAGSVGQVQVMRLMYPNIDVIHLAGYLRQEFPLARLAIVDGYALSVEATIAAVCLHNPDVIFVHGDTPTATAIYAIVDPVKAAFPGAMVAVFGEHSSALPEEPFQRSSCDVVLMGDPEPTAAAVCKVVKEGGSTSAALKDVPNIVYRNSSNEISATARISRPQNLDDLPPAARDLVDMASYKGTYHKISERETSVLAARGCPWRCTYCGPAWHRALDKPRFRYRSPQSLVDELERLQATYGIDDFMLDITTFNFNPRWAIEVCHEIISRNLRLNLKSHLRADRVNDELLGAMRKAGFWLIYLGIESFNDRTLKGVRKEITVEQIEKSLQQMKSAGLKVVAELMNCLFWEEDGQLHHEGVREAMQTLSFARRAYRQGLIHAMYWTSMMPVPASESYSIALRHDLIEPDSRNQWHLWFPIQSPIVRLPGLSSLAWYWIQWIGKLHQAYFMLNSNIVHRSRVGLVRQRALQLAGATLRRMLWTGKPTSGHALPVHASATDYKISQDRRVIHIKRE